MKLEAERLRVTPDQILNLLRSGTLGLTAEALQQIVDFKIEPQRFILELLHVSGSPVEYRELAKEATRLLVREGARIVPDVMKVLNGDKDNIINGALTVLLELQLPRRASDSILTLEQLRHLEAAIRTIDLRFCASGGNPALRRTINMWRSASEFGAFSECQKAALPKSMITLAESQERPSDFTVGRSVLEHGDPLVLGLSIGNGRFNKERVATLIEWACTISPDVILMITDGPGIYNRLALGDSMDEARAYCERKGRQLRSYAADAGSCYGWNVWSWHRTYQHQEYISAYQQVTQLYEQSQSFREDCRAQTYAVLQSSLDEGSPQDAQVDLAVRYLLEELAALSAGPAILGCRQLAYAYYHEWKPFQKYVRGEYGNARLSSLGFVEYRFNEPHVRTGLDAVGER